MMASREYLAEQIHALVMSRREKIINGEGNSLGEDLDHAIADLTSQLFVNELREFVLDMDNMYPKNPDVKAGIDLVLARLEERFGLEL